MCFWVCGDVYMRVCVYMCVFVCVCVCVCVCVYVSMCKYFVLLSESEFHVIMQSCNTFFYLSSLRLVCAILFEVIHLLHL